MKNQIFKQNKNSKSILNNKCCKYSLLLFCFIFIIFEIKFKSLIQIKKSTLIKRSKNKNELTDKKVKDMNCYTTNVKYSKKILHIIITRFLIEFKKATDKKLYTNEYIQNGIRVMKEYLFPSLEHQNCKNFIWMLKIGNKANYLI